MLNRTSSKALLLATGAVAAGLALGPVASADPATCETSGSAKVCQGTSSATPPVPGGGGAGGGTAGGGTGQNGSYGPSGNTPPVGN